MRLTGDRTEPENELLAWLRSAYGVVSFTGTSAQSTEVLILSLTSIDFLKLSLDKAFQVILHFFARVSAQPHLVCFSFFNEDSVTAR